MSCINEAQQKIYSVQGQERQNRHDRYSLYWMYCI